jgi:hypothetical protein
MYVWRDTRICMDGEIDICVCTYGEIHVYIWMDVRLASARNFRRILLILGIQELICHRYVLDEH